MASGLLFHDQERVKDAFHDSFERFLQYLNKGRIRNGSEFPYFVTTLRNEINRARFESWKILPLNFEPIYWDGTDDDREIRAIIDAVLASDVLPDRQRQVFGLVVVLDYRLLDARRMIGISRPTEHRYLTHAKRRVCKILRAFGYGPGYDHRPEIIEFEREMRRRI